MYRLYDDFRACDDNRQPYSFSVEKHTPIDNMHAWVKDECFCMASIGNRYILNTPGFTSGSFAMNFRVSYMAEFATEFFVCFGYDEASRSGSAVRYVYDLKDRITLSLLEVCKNSTKILASKEYTVNTPLMEDTSYEFVMNIDGGKVTGTAAGCEYEFDITGKKGKLAIERANFIGELIIENVRFASSEEFDTQTVVAEKCVDIPLINGGDIPYRLMWRIDKIAGEHYLTAKLDGGTKTRKVNREDRPGQYVAEKDWMTAPYVGICNKTEKPRTFCLIEGENAFIDPNIYWDCQKGFFGDTELPIVNTYKIPSEFVNEDLEIVFGYENLFCSGYGTQEGGCEFHFSPLGELTYMGDAPDGRDIYELRSQEDKLALGFVPEDCYEREQVIEHIKNNHYFDVSEDIDFTFVMKTMTDTEFLTVKASVLNVYESEVLGSFEPRISTEAWDYGYKLIRAKVLVPKMSIGVYKAEFSVCYGGKEYKRFVKVFEVYDKDSDINPALAVGLPFTFTMQNEQKWLMRNGFDLWNPMPSCDLEHYYNCITDNPHEAQIRQPWKLTKSFKREWFAWVASRTCKDWSTEKFLDVIENCDYLFRSVNEEVLDLSQSSLYPMRQDHHIYDNFMMREGQRVAILDRFLNENPDIAEKVDYKVGMDKFTYEHYINLMQTCAKEWMEYQNAEGVRIIRQQNEELKKINPNAKRAIYGPINVYTTPTHTNHSLRVFGNSDMKALSEDIFTGFAIYEDYPYSCSYQTYRGAFGVMTILLHSPELTIYPEQYSGSRGGCIDGAVKFAHAPMGASVIHPYQNSTHAFEYVFNTSYRLKDGYHYWNTYGFHRGPAVLEGLIKDWRYALENKPKRPLKSTAFLAEYSSDEDVFEIHEFKENDSKCYIMNQSESGHGLVFECTREAGIPNGFALKYDVLSELSASECDVLVLPSLAYADKNVIGEIRRLYNEGVNLLAVSDVPGLEDLFGILPDKRIAKVNCVCYNGKNEYVRENDAVLSYKADGAEVVMQSAEGEPLIFANERTAIINTAVTNLGSADSQYMSIANSLHIVGDLVRCALKDILRKLSKPLAVGENVGVTLFETHDGRCELLAIDYTPFDNKEHCTKEAVIRINIDNITDVKCERETFVGKKDGKVKEIRFDIRPHESVFVELIKIS